MVFIDGPMVFLRFIGGPMVWWAHGFLEPKFTLVSTSKLWASGPGSGIGALDAPSDDDAGSKFPRI